MKSPKKAPSKTNESPNLTVTLLTSVSKKPPIIQIKTEGQIDQWILLENKNKI